MNDEIKSAYEIAMEKIEKIGEATEEERLKWKYYPQGEKLAALFLKDDADLPAELGKFDEKAEKYAKAGASEVLVRNINLPRDDVTRKNNKKAMDGLKSIKKDKVRVENVYSNIRRVFEHHQGQGAQQRKQAYESLKAQFTAKVQQAIQQQMGQAAMGIKIDVEKQPQFQEEWQRLQVQLNASYTKVLGELKQELVKIP